MQWATGLNFSESEEVLLLDSTSNNIYATVTDRKTVERIVDCFLNTTEVQLDGEGFSDTSANEKSITITVVPAKLSHVETSQLPTCLFSVSILGSNALIAILDEIRTKGPVAKSTIGLLETLSRQVGCFYLSDLRLKSNHVLLRRVLRRIVPGEYSIHEWNDAVSYICGIRGSFMNQQEAANYLAAYLRK